MQEKTFALSRRALLRTAAVGAAATAATATIPSVVMAADGVAADTSKIRNFDMIEAFYREYPKKLAVVRGTLNRPLTLTEKILFTHLYHPESLREFKRGVDYIELRPDRAGTHDIGGPMAIIQFLSSGKERIALPAALVCDHLVQANVGAIPDLKVAEKGNVETYEFLRDVSRRYGFDFWPAGSGICHQVFMENYNFPGCMMLVTDSHTPTACGMGMLAIGVGGADLVDALMGMEWELKMPKIIGVKLTGQLQGWASAKDVILKLTGMLSTKGATNCVVEFFGEGAATLSASGKATIGNMGAEMGATTSVFAYDDSMARYLAATGRQAVADLAAKVDLAADKEVYAAPAKYYDRVVEINLSELEPHINGPFSPDAAMPISKVAETVKSAAASGRPDRLLHELLLRGHHPRRLHCPSGTRKRRRDQDPADGRSRLDPHLRHAQARRRPRGLRKTPRHRPRHRLRSLHRPVEAHDRQPQGRQDAQLHHRVLQPQLRRPQRRQPAHQRLPRLA